MLSEEEERLQYVKQWKEKGKRVKYWTNESEKRQKMRKKRERGINYKGKSIK
jgi:hypothetical protein